MTADQYKSLIAADLDLDGDSPEAVRFRVYIATVWDFYASQQRQGNTVRYLYTKRQVIDKLLAGSYKLVYYQDGDVSEQLGNIFDHLTKMRATVDEELTLALSRRQSATSAAAPITAQFPIEPGQCEPDPNAREYRGDPLRRSLPPR